MEEVPHAPDMSERPVMLRVGDAAAVFPAVIADAARRGEIGFGESQQIGGGHFEKTVGAHLAPLAQGPPDAALEVMDGGFGQRGLGVRGALEVGEQLRLVLVDFGYAAPMLA